MNSVGLGWVLPELDAALDGARSALESFAEGEGQRADALACRDELHRVRGALRMLEYHGVAAVIEELERIAQSLAVPGAERRGAPVEALMRGILQCADYLQHLASGNTYAPAVLLPLLNELRAARGASALGASALFAPRLRAPLSPPRGHGTVSAQQVKALAASLLPAYQRALLLWLRDRDARSLETIARVLQRMERAVASPALWRVWWLASAIVDALRKGALPPAAAVKRALVQLEQLLRAVAASEPAPVHLAPPPELLRALLFCAAHAGPANARIPRIRECFGLDGLLPTGPVYEQAARTFAGPDLKALRALAEALGEELERVELMLDAFARDSLPGVASLSPVSALLARVAECFGVLNLGQLRQVLLDQAGQVRAAVAADRPPSTRLLLDLATGLLQARRALDALVNSGVTAAQALPFTRDAGSACVRLSVLEVTALDAAVLGEVGANLATVRDAVMQVAGGGPPAQLLADVECAVRQAVGALAMLDLDRGAALLQRWKRHAFALLRGDAGRDAPRAVLESLAEILVGLEYYLEAVIGQQPGGGELLEPLWAQIEALGADPGETAAVGDAPGTLDAVAARAPVALEALPEPAAPRSADLVFKSEVRNLCEALAVSLSSGAAPGPATLEGARRALNTVEVSARLVGVEPVAALMSAARAAVEALADGRVSPGPALNEPLARAATLAPRLALSLTPNGDAAPEVDLAALERALREKVGGAPPSGAATPAGGDWEGHADTEDVRRIFLEEAVEVLDAGDAIMQRWKEAPGELQPVHQLQRELHTLKGGAHMANVPAVGDLSHSMESALTQVADGRVPVTDRLLGLMEHCLDRLVDMTEQIRAGQVVRPARDLVRRIDGLLQDSVPHDPGTDAELPVVRAAAAADKNERVQIAAELLDEIMTSASGVSASQAVLAHRLDGLRETAVAMRDLTTRAQECRDLDDGAGLAEALAALVQRQGELLEASGEALELLDEQTRAGAELQGHLIHARLSPFAENVPRYRRLVRRILLELGKQGEFRVSGEETLIDRSILDRISPAIEHMLRNAVSHGIERAEARRASGKATYGMVEIAVHREGADVVLEVSDDGAGLDREAIRTTALRSGLLAPDEALDDDILLSLILRPGFSTAGQVTRIAGRGLGMDVVHSEVRKLGGTLSLRTRAGRGTTFTLRVPFSFVVTPCLLVTTAGETVAVPLTGVLGVHRPGLEALERLRGGAFALDELLELSATARSGPDRQGVVEVGAGAHRLALLVDEVGEQRELIVKPAAGGRARPGALGTATVPEGLSVMVLDVAAVIRMGADRLAPASSELEARPLHDAPVRRVLVVDDSMTVRQVTRRLLSREGIQVSTAKDGVEALAVLRSERPDAVLLDIEMPRMDGFEVASVIRADPMLRDLPIVMITSRVGAKHVRRAEAIGVERYLGKPYQDSELLEVVQAVIDHARRARESATRH